MCAPHGSRQVYGRLESILWGDTVVKTCRIEFVEGVEERPAERGPEALFSQFFIVVTGPMGLAISVNALAATSSPRTCKRFWMG